jgi:hypothetical protein
VVGEGDDRLSVRQADRAEAGRIVAATFAGMAQEEDVSRLFDAGTQGHLPVIAIFTGIRTEDELVEQLRLLSRGARWRFAREHPEGLATDDVMVGIEWKIRDGLASSPMGFAPFGTMPVTRRALYVCIAAWPGEHENANWTRYDEQIVHFLDTDLAALKLSKAKYRSLTKASKDTTQALLSEPHDDARYYRRTAFRLSASTANALSSVWS